MTLRRWLSSGKIPAARLRQASRHYPLFSYGEVATIGQVLAAFEQQGVYLTDNSPAIEVMAERIAAYRRANAY